MSTVLFVIFYDAGDAIVGITTGILTRNAGDGTLDERAAVAAIEAIFADPVKNLLFQIGIYAWMLALVAAAVALFRSGTPRLPLVFLIPSALFLNLDHAFPFGSLTFATFLVTAVWVEFGRKPLATSSEPSKPAATERGTRRVL